METQPFLNRFTHLSRPIDLHYPSNQFVLGAMSLFFTLSAVITYLDDSNLAQSLTQGLRLMMVIILTWATGREIDPDHPFTADLAAVMSGMAALRGPLPDLTALFALLLCIRIVSRSIGLVPTALDMVLMTGVVVVAAIVQHVWVIALSAAATFALDAALPRPNRPQGIVAAVFFAGLALVSVIIALPWDSAAWELTVPSVAAAAILMLAFTAVILNTSPDLAAVTDATAEPLSYSRVLAAQIILQNTAFVAFIWGGVAGMNLLLPAWLLMASVIVRYAYTAFYK